MEKLFRNIPYNLISNFYTLTLLPPKDSTLQPTSTPTPPPTPHPLSLFNELSIVRNTEVCSTCTFLFLGLTFLGDHPASLPNLVTCALAPLFARPNPVRLLHEANYILHNNVYAT